MDVGPYKDGEGRIGERNRFGPIWHEVKRYFRSPRCLFGHVFSSTEVGTDGETFDYYCARCQKKIKSEPIGSSLGFRRFKKMCDEEGIDLDLPIQTHRGGERFLDGE